jgi:hypothetical protein
MLCWFQIYICLRLLRFLNNRTRILWGLSTLLTCDSHCLVRSLSACGKLSMYVPLRNKWLKRKCGGMECGVAFFREVCLWMLMLGNFDAYVLVKLAWKYRLAFWMKYASKNAWGISEKEHVGYTSIILVEVLHVLLHHFGLLGDWSVHPVPL